MPTFTVPSAGAVSFTVTEEQFVDKSGLCEEWSTTLIVDDATAWGALFALRTPRELVSVRACRGVPGSPPTVIVDVGGGVGAGDLDISPLNLHQALLVELSSDAPFADDRRVAKASWLIMP